MWFTSPLKSLKTIFWEKYKWNLFVTLIILFLVMFVILFVYAIPVSLCQVLSLITTRKLRYRKDDRAMRPIYRCPENFGESLSTPTPPCLQNF